MARIICGVDVSAKTLDVRIGRDGAWQQFARTAGGIRELAAFCRHHQVGLVVREATGGYERVPFGQLWAKAIAVAMVSPRAVRRFAEAVGKLEKTDRIDCGIIARYAEAAAVQPTPPASVTQQHLTALVLRLRQLTEPRTQQNNQRRLVTDPDVLATFTALLATLAKQLRALERQIAALIEADPLSAALNRAFREIKDMGARPASLPAPSLVRVPISGRLLTRRATLATVARNRANGWCAAAGRASARSSMSWSAASVVITPTSETSTTGSRQPVNRPRSFAWRWPASCWSGSTPKLVTYERSWLWPSDGARHTD